MRRALLYVFPFILLSVTVATFGQKNSSHPDISGTWKLNLKKSGISEKKRAAWPETITITSDGLNIEMRHASVVDGHEIVQMFVADGQRHIVKYPDRGEIESMASWDKSTLVVVQGKHESWQPARNPPLITARWELSKDGRTLTNMASVTDSAGRALVYERQ